MEQHMVHVSTIDVPETEVTDTHVLTPEEVIGTVSSEEVVGNDVGNSECTTEEMQVAEMMVNDDPTMTHVQIVEVIESGVEKTIEVVSVPQEILTSDMDSSQSYTIETIMTQPVSNFTDETETEQHVEIIYTEETIEQTVEGYADVSAEEAASRLAEDAEKLQDINCEQINDEETCVADPEGESSAIPDGESDATVDSTVNKPDIPAFETNELPDCTNHSYEEQLEVAPTSEENSFVKDKSETAEEPPPEAPSVKEDEKPKYESLPDSKTEMNDTNATEAHRDVECNENEIVKEGDAKSVEAAANETFKIEATMAEETVANDRDYEEINANGKAPIEHEDSSKKVDEEEIQGEESLLEEPEASKSENIENEEVGKVEEAQQVEEKKDESKLEEVQMNEAQLEEAKKGEAPQANTEVAKLSDLSNLQKEVVPATPAKPPTRQRSVVQDIVDDWADENQEEPINDVQRQPVKSQDTVEIELKSLLDDERNIELISLSHEQERQLGDMDEQTNVVVLTIECQNEESKKKPSKKEQNEQAPSSIPTQVLTRSSKVPTTQEPTKQKSSLQSPRHGIKLVSPSEVSEVLKERLRQKQKDLSVVQSPDLFFVKKITQRLSNKLSAATSNTVPGLIPLPNSTSRVVETSEGSTESGKSSSVDNRELLAILEGDVDPDWSNLKPPTLTEEPKAPEIVVEHTLPPKLDPLVERELALKQLLELPSVPVKKGNVKKRKTFKPAPKKALKEGHETGVKKTPAPRQYEKKVVHVDLIESSAEKSETSPSDKIDLKDEASAQELRGDESRSGRKRKPTEKAREHEQNTTKRQKVYKGKVQGNKKASSTQGDESASEVSLPEETEQAPAAVENEQSPPKQVPSKQGAVKSVKPQQTTTSARPKQSLVKKGQPIAKRKIAVKKLLRQKSAAASNGPSSKKSKLSKMSLGSKKSNAKVSSSKTQKRLSDASNEPKPKKKIINEIDRLLQDEGVVNLLYDVEQPGKKRLVPVTKSQTKVMDMQKVQRELKIRAKMVRNAVMRLRTSGASTTKVSSRSKRSVGTGHSNETPPPPQQQPQQQQQQEKTSNEVKPAADSAEFIFPAKIRNAADASIIIRRHSSSSFSSASGSPRVSIEGPDRQGGTEGKLDEQAAHILRSTKRRHSQDEKTAKLAAAESKKSRKKAALKADVEKVESKLAVEANTEVVEEKATTRSNKRVDAKKTEKSTKSEVSDSDESRNDSGSVSKVVTRSNGAATVGKSVPKSKKIAKSKVTFTRANDNANADATLNEDGDELANCLAEAATALSTVSGIPSRSGSTTVTRKAKGGSGKVLEDEGSKKQNLDVGNQFSNKEITVRRHGNLVQLTLTPSSSSSSKIKNGITLQVMREFRETLSILKRDDDCRVVLFTSTGGSFCEGLELSGLVHTDKDVRRVCAEEMANGVKDFIKSLATFNKPIVAGVQGAAVGLGVTMLPLFDIVIASDKATFSTPYGKLGHIAEGAAIFTLSHTLGSAVTSDLLLSGRTLTANEALRTGLVTRVLWPDRFQGELLPSLWAMSEQSSQSMEATKALLRHSLRKKLDAALESESYLLVQQWCSAECQTAIKAYIDGQEQ